MISEKSYFSSCYDSDGLLSPGFMTKAQEKLERSTQARSEYLAENRQLTGQIKSLNDQLSNLEDYKRNDKTRYPWTSYIVSLIHTPGQKHSLITSLFCLIFPPIKRMVKFQDETYQTIQNHTPKIKELEGKLEAIEPEGIEVIKRYNTHLERVRVMEAEQLAMDLFGGLEEFRKLPVLDISHQLGERNLHVTLDDLTAPIMRGRDELGRLFFTIRAKDARGEMVCDVVQSLYTNSGYWTSGGRIMDAIGFIDNLNSRNRFAKEYNVLKNFIETRKLVQPNDYMGRTSFEIC